MCHLGEMGWRRWDPVENGGVQEGVTFVRQDLESVTLVGYWGDINSV